MSFLIKTVVNFFKLTHHANYGKKSPPPSLSALTRGELDGAVLTRWERLKALEPKVVKNSNNSSQPPSSDGLCKSNSLHEPSGNQAGIQSSHQGSTPRRMDESTETIGHPLPRQRTPPMLNADEPGLRAADKLHWRHIAASDTLTRHDVHAERGLIVLVHDYWAPDWRLGDSIPSLCYTHLLRELVYVKKLTSQQWLESIMQLLLCANRVCTAVRRQQRTLDADDVAAFRTVYGALVPEGEALHPETAQPPVQCRRGKQAVAVSLLRRFRLTADAVLRFISDPAVPFANNVGERAVRTPKVKQEISGGFRAVAGAEHFCVIRSSLHTLRKQRHSMLSVLHRTIAGNPIQIAT